MLADPTTLDAPTMACYQFARSGPKTPPSAPPAIPPIIINPFSYHTPAPAIDPLHVPPGPPLAPPQGPRQRL
ncbi:hypothetical protein [Massilia sp. DWR3-1-1]|uniref:hypothetical protein n=1 Tax=Massilia sp. DWR3-1-1 TaxID=2804559 RepID=UPI003CE6E70C